jgi:antitoxin (DNA-binding transcriptional repressor) of toxin-antitoxin stability system
MKIRSVAEFKAKFSEIIEDVKNGEEIGVLYGKRQEMVGVFIPVSNYAAKNPRKLGLLQNKASFRIVKNFKIMDEDLLKS